MTAHSASGMDILVIGGGIAGSVTALLLARQGRRVTVVDPFPVYPTDFRCEKLTSDQLDRLKRLDLYELFAAASTPVKSTVVARRGRAIDVRPTDELCFRYETVVNAVRRAWPKDVTFVEGRVDDIDASADGSSVTLTDGRRLDARLIVLATGPGEKLRARLGLERRILRANQSICIGFDVVAGAGGPLSPRSLIYYGEKQADGIAFMTVFPYADRTRCNFFGYLPPASPEATAIRKDPLAGLAPLMPHLFDVIGRDAHVIGKAEMRVADLFETLSPERDGLVVVGDAFRSSCPVTGTGVTRVLADVGQLCTVHVPRWFETPGMTAAKIASYYADPEKRAVDAAAAANAEAQRRFARERNVLTRARRVAAYVKSRVHFVLSRQPKSALSLRPQEAYSAAAAGAPASLEAFATRGTAQPRMTV